MKAVRLSSPKRQSNLETANEMYKMAFLVKKNKFSREFPKLTESEILQKTMKYFKELPKD
jgi:hypothetical protein